MNPKFSTYAISPFQTSGVSVNRAGDPMTPDLIPPECIPASISKKNMGCFFNVKVCQKVKIVKKNDTDVKTISRMNLLCYKTVIIKINVIYIKT